MSKMTTQEKSWIFYDWANSAYSMTITSTILPLYFKMMTDSAGISGPTSTAYWGYANSFATLLVSILAPILGTIADYKNFKKRFFAFFFGLGIVFTTLLAAVPKEQWFVLLCFYVITVLGFSGTNIFYDAFLVDVTTEDRMDKISTTGYAYGYIGSTIPFIISIVILLLAQKNILPLSIPVACQLSFVIAALWWGLFTIPMLKNVKQLHFIEIEANPIKNSFKRLGNTFKNIKAHKALFMFLIAYFFYIDGVDTIIKMATSYGSDLGLSSNTLLIVLLVTQFVAFPFALLYGKLSQKFTGKKMLYVAIIIYICICTYAYFLKTALDFWILAILVGTSQGGIQALSRSYFGKLVPKENSNEFFGFYNIFGKFAAIIGPFLVGIVSQTTGRTNNGVFSIIILFIIGGILLAKVPDPAKATSNN
jgi:UMF1 family MFS transporter